MRYEMLQWIKGQGGIPMFDLIDQMVKAANRYTFWDYFFLKAAVLFFGILIGTYFYNFFIEHTLFSCGLLFLPHMSTSCTGLL